jgi:hypothetical protein
MSDFAFTLPVGDSADWQLTVTDAEGAAVNLTGWALTFTAGSVSKTSGVGQVTVSAPGNIVGITVNAGDFGVTGNFDASLVATSGTDQSTWLGTVSVFDAGYRYLTTLPRVRTYLWGDKQTVVADEILSTLIASSSAWVEQQIGGPVLTSTITETRNGDGGTRMLLWNSHGWRPGHPETEIVSLHIDGAAIPARAAVSTSDTNPTGYAFSADGIDLVGYSFTVGLRNVTVVYTHGYMIIPVDIEQATLAHVALKYRDRDGIGLEVSSGGGESISYGNAATLGYIESVLAPYRIVGVG